MHGYRYRHFKSPPGIDLEEPVPGSGRHLRPVPQDVTPIIGTSPVRCSASLHTLFEGQYNELHDAADTLAERIRALGRFAPGSYASFSRLSSIKEDNDEVPAAMSMIANLVMGHEALGRTLRSAFKVAEAGGDQATMDLLIGRMEASDKAAWMLRSHLENSGED